VTARKKILASILFLAVLGGVAWQIYRRREPDPIFEGRPLSYWLERTGTEKREAAVRHAGTNAIPLLLQLVRSRDSLLKRKLMELGRSEQYVKIPFTADTLLHRYAVDGFFVLGPDAKSAVPELMRIFTSRASEDAQESVVISLGLIGNEARASIPLLVGATTNYNDKLRMDALHALGEIASQPDVTVPALMNALDDPSEQVEASALDSLSDFGSQATAAVPRLLKFRKDLQSKRNFALARVMADYALKNIDPAAAANAGIETTNASPAE
jgi:HEAT repeat protein